MAEGYIKLHRKMLDNPIVCKDSDYFSVWVYLLLHAVHSKCDVSFGKERITLLPGQLTTGRKVIANKLKISESKVQRILDSFEKENQIEQITNYQCRIVTICSWTKYQVKNQASMLLQSEQQSEQPNAQKVNNKMNNKVNNDITKKLLENPTILEHYKNKVNNEMNNTLNSE